MGCPVRRCHHRPFRTLSLGPQIPYFRHLFVPKSAILPLHYRVCQGAAPPPTKATGAGTKKIMSIKTTVIAATSDIKLPAAQPASAKSDEAEILRHRRAKVALGL